jgi:hypothetical protein
MCYAYMFVVVIMIPTQSSTVDDASRGLFVLTTWLVDVLLLNVVDGHSQYKVVLWI